MNSLMMVEWLLSDECDLRCGLCATPSPASPLRQRLPPRQVLSVAQYLVDIEVFTVVITGKEPLLHPQIYEVIHTLTKGGVQVLLFTNGLLIDEKAVSALEESSVSAVQVTIDGEERTHDALKGVNGAFKKSVEAVRRLASSFIPTGVCTTIFRENFGQISDIARYVMGLGAQTYSVRWCMPCGRFASCENMLLQAEQWKNVLSTFLGLQSRVDIKLVSMDPLLVPLTTPALKIQAPEFRNCGVGSNMCAIQYDGSVTPCAYIEEVAGNVTNQSLREIWESPVFEKYRSKETIIGGKCERCMWSSHCGGGCKARSYEIYKDISEPDPLCWVDP